MTDILNWTQHSEALWVSSGGDHEWLALDLGEASSTPGYPWFLVPEDRHQTRVTNLERCKDIAELCERDATAFALLMPVGR
jgi:hypothetical protein